jgi:hypothetical protein
VITPNPTSWPELRDITPERVADHPADGAVVPPEVPQVLDGSPGHAKIPGC